ncbi:MAG: hypothetical protein JRS35_24690, partial [Deltaproteobacteria bacterium]|nr:hypothetical protein [Deltaproteobacteria bacterium]
PQDEEISTFCEEWLREPEIGAEAPEATAAIALKLAGLPARQAEAVASRPLPELPQLGENAAA